jgi:glycosyltransferase involved in cell wall biosynthesis
MIELVCSLELVDETWYAQAIGLGGDRSPLAHFLHKGWPSGHAPNPFFDPGWYRTTYSDVVAAQADPLTHYLEYGEIEGRWPCRILDPAWYAKTQGLKPGGGVVLAHYLRHGASKGLKPNPIFDPNIYLANNLDLPSNLREAAIHYVTIGFREPRNQNNANNANVASEIRRYTAPGALFEEFDPELMDAGPARAKVIAFYLPQFHAIPENDEFWGTGFTEWRNVCRGQPRFVGHYQPRLPRDLGFYDLVNDPSVMRRQIKLAKAAGIHGFCFYYYQFGKRKLLEKPLERFLADPSLDLPFCLMWANENWTRRWDGQDSEILLEQKYSAEDDEHLIAAWSGAMADARYIRVEGRPLLIVYRPAIIPDMRERLIRWRRLFRERGLKPWLLMAQTFQDHDPTSFGFDGAVEFPPHKLYNRMPPISDKIAVLDPHFDRNVRVYEDMITTSLEEPEPMFPLIKTACPSWDNDARRQGSGGSSITNSTPAAYQGWMEALIERARENRFGGEAFVFVNAWNEWAEAAYLEPDVHFGSAYLNATARAVVGPVALAGGKPHLLLVGHDAHEHGAQMTLLNLGRTFVKRFGLNVTFLLLGAGNLVPRYREFGTVVITSPQAPDLGDIIEKFRDQGIQFAVTNTVVTGCVVPHLKRQGIRVLSLVHELPRLIREFSVEEFSRAIARESDVVVFAAEYVRHAFEAELAAVAKRHTIMPQGLYAKIDPEPNARAAVRTELGVPADARIVLGVGYGDLRKGIDIFFDTARLAADSNPELVFVWVGRLERTAATWLLECDGGRALPANVRHVPFTPAINRHLQAADVFYLTSREDPFPSTVLEALSCGLPVVGFAGCTGIEALIARFGTVVPLYDKGKALDALITEISRQTAERSAARQAVVAADFLWEDYAFRLLQELNPSWRRISVVVPNYNYARYVGNCLESIFRQTVPVYEVIVLDDASSDDSRAVIEQVTQQHGREIRLVVNDKNSGSVMRQWARGAREASGELVWIAEADDMPEPKLLERLAAMSGSRTVMAFSDSTPIDNEGKALERSYKSYMRRFHGDAFEASFNCDAALFATRFLATANIILNVSAVLFRREALLDVLDRKLDELATYRFAGDWLTYLSICRQPGEVAYCARTLNKHRRHEASATHRTGLAAHLAEIARVHAAFGRLFDAAPKVLASQRAYRAELRVQFGLMEKEGVAAEPAATEIEAA